jgi:GWxTD domain-containing protein
MNKAKLTYLVIVLVILSCARSFNPDIERGTDYAFNVGYPEVRFSSIGFMEADEKGYINITADILQGSLIYKKEKEKLVSNIDIEIQLLDQNTEELIKNFSSTFTFEKKNPDVYNSQDVFDFQKKLSANPGTYDVVLTIKDLHSEKETTRRTSATVPDPKANSMDLTSVQMMGKGTGDNKGWSSINTYDVQSKADSIKFIVQVVNNTLQQDLNVKAQLKRYHSDTSIANPMHFEFVSFDKKRGVNYNDETVIQSTTRELRERGKIFLEFKFPMLAKGNYSFEIRTNTERNELFKARDFGIKSSNYPTIKSPKEFARPLVYIMSENEYDEMMSVGNPDSLRKTVEKFWLKNIGSKNKAKNAIRLYYQRVEEANKQFSNFKEGWKTDRGMIYILFGPPWYVKKEIDSNNIRWSYSHDHYDSELNFTFVQAKRKSEFFPFENYILNRSNSYFQLQYQQIQLWKSGIILTSRL